MPGAFEIAGVYARKTTAFRENPTVEVEIRLTGGAAGRAVITTRNPNGKFTDAVWSGVNLTDYPGYADEMVEYVNTILNDALMYGDACNQDEMEHLMLNADPSDHRLRINDDVLPAVALALERARSAQMRVG